ncbi:MAG: hypothetical protein ACREIA_23615 [Opitutaceae bacterium]
MLMSFAMARTFAALLQPIQLQFHRVEKVMPAIIHAYDRGAGSRLSPQGEAARGLLLKSVPIAGACRADCRR